MIPVQRAFRQLTKDIEALNRRMAASHMHGKVVEIDGPRVRLELAPQDSRTGKPFLSPWVQFQEAAGDGAGGFSSHTPPAIGETMRLLSPSGELGPQSLAIRDGYTEANPRPTDDGAAHVLKHGDARITMSGDGIVIAVGGASVRITADEILTTARTRLNNGTRKVHYVGGLDDGGDAAVDGADVFV